MHDKAEFVQETADFVPETTVPEPTTSQADKVTILLERILKRQYEIQDSITALRMEMISEVHDLEERMTRKIENVKDSIVEELERRLKKKTKVVDVEDDDSEETKSEVKKFDERKHMDGVKEFIYGKMDDELDFSFFDEQRVGDVIAEQEQFHLVQLTPPVQTTEEAQKVDDSMAIVAYSSPLELVQPIKKDKGKNPINDKFMWIHFEGEKYEKPAEVLKNKIMIMEDEHTMLPEWVLSSDVMEVNTFTSSKSFINPADEVRDIVKEDVVFISKIGERDVIGSSNQVVIIDVDWSKVKEFMEMMKESRKIEDENAELFKKLVIEEKRYNVERRLATDKDFQVIFEKMKFYVDNVDDLWKKTPDEIVSECFINDCNRVVQLIYDKSQEKKVDMDQILEDISVDVTTLTVSQMKEFLKRYGFISYQVNKMSVEDMGDQTKQIQLSLLKKIPREQAEQMFDAGLFDIPKDFENRARFFSSQFPQISTQRIVHWKYDGKRECYMVKRVTGATHVLYSSQEVARLTEEDLYELADIKIDDEEDHEEVMMFTKFLKKQKKKNFEDINFAHPQSIRTNTIQYFQSEGMSLREILKEQYLCLKFEHVPKQSTINLLDKLKRWYLDSRSYEYVFERSGESSIRFYHPSEINMFTFDDLKKITTVRPVGKTEWNACIFEMLEDIAKGLLNRQKKKTDDGQKTVERERKEREEKEKEKAEAEKTKKDTRKRPQRKKAGTIKIRN